MASGSERSGRSEASLTIIAVGTRVTGEVQSSGVVKVEGTVNGTVRAEHQVLVARGGLVEGDVYSVEAVIGGRVEGAVNGTERVEVQTGAAVHGDVATKALVVAEGGEINGLVKMTGAPEQPQK
jgi:cytoskeletal protein CcmA (bactofilin family)